MPRCRKLLPLLTLVGALAAPAAASAAITEYSPSGMTAPARNIVTGSDGNLWFTQPGNGSIGRLNPSTGLADQFPMPNADSSPADIAAGPDGNLWFTDDGGAGAIGRITPAGVVTRFSVGLTGMNDPAGITAGPDGNLWFTEQGLWGRIGRITPTGTITEFPIADFGSRPTDIAAGDDGNLWFTERADPGRIGRISPVTGAITEFTAGLTPDSAPSAIAAASSGKLYFTQAGGPGGIGRIKTDGKIEEYTDGLTPNSEPVGIAEGGDEALWFTTGANPGRLGRLWPDDDDIITEFTGGSAPGLSADASPAGITRGPDGEIWFTETAPPARIGRMTVPPSVDGSSTVTPPAVSPITPPTSAPAPTAPGGGDDAADLPPSGAPVLGVNVAVGVLSGTVRIKLPGHGRFVPLAAGARVPVGSLIDTRRGRVVLRSALRHGRSQKGTFWGAIFQIRQRRLGRGMTDLILRGGRFGTCPTRVTRAGASVLARETGGRRRVVRRLWGKDRHGRFRTHGRDSVATVRGTRWVTTDRCDGTLTRVSAGKVLVRDLSRHRSVLLTAGRAYLARHRQR